MKSITLQSPLDMHVHVRQEDVLRNVVPFTAEQFVGAVCMPNTVPPIDRAERLDRYINEIQEACGDLSFDPYVPLFFRNDFTEADLAPIQDRLFGQGFFKETKVPGGGFSSKGCRVGHGVY